MAMNRGRSYRKEHGGGSNWKGHDRASGCDIDSDNDDDDDDGSLNVEE